MTRQLRVHDGRYKYNLRLEDALYARIQVLAARAKWPVNTWMVTVLERAVTASEGQQQAAPVAALDAPMAPRFNVFFENRPPHAPGWYWQSSKDPKAEWHGPFTTGAVAWNAAEKSEAA